MTYQTNFVRHAFEETLDVLDERTKQMIITNLERAGEYDRDSNKLSIVTLANGLRRLFGEEAANLMLEEFLIRLDALAAIKTKET